MTRRVAVTIAIATGIAGCIVPSFDDLKKSGGDDSISGGSSGIPSSQKATGGASNDDAAKSTSGGAGVPPPVSPPPGSVPDAGGDGAPAAKTFYCEQSARRCAVGTEICCTAWKNVPYGPVTVDCTSPSNSSGCTAGFFRCGDSSDCPTTQYCCFDNSLILTTNEVGKCSASACSDAILCDPAKSPTTCPSGKSCTGKRTAGQATATVCQ
jgi:hypothetical protein